jgi:hypothetical protein
VTYITANFEGKMGDRRGITYSGREEMLGQLLQIKRLTVAEESNRSTNPGNRIGEVTLPGEKLRGGWRFFNEG